MRQHKVLRTPTLFQPTSRPTRPSAALAFALVIALLTAVLSTASPAHGSTPTTADPVPVISVSKTKKLAQVQRIVVTGSNFADDGAWVKAFQCPTTELSDACRTVTQAVQAKAGELSARGKVTRELGEDGRRIDCGKQAVACQLVVTTSPTRIEESPAVLQTIPLRFRTHRPLLELEFSPKSGFRDGQEVEVTVVAPAGRTNRVYQISQCANWQGSGQRICDDGLRLKHGETGVIVLKRVYWSGRTPIDCAAARDRCVITVRGVQKRWRLAFAKTDEPIPVPTVSYAALDGLLDVQPLVVKVSTPYYGTEVTQCLTKSVAGKHNKGCIVIGHGPIQPVDGESFAWHDETIATVPRRVLWRSGKAFDCAVPGTCEVSTTTPGYGKIDKRQALTFVDDGPPKLPRINIARAELTNGDVATVEFIDMPLPRFFQLWQCVDSDALSFCQELQSQNLQSTDFSLDLRLSQYLRNGNTVFDCGEIARSCFLKVTFTPNANSPRFKLNFKPQ